MSANRSSRTSRTHTPPPPKRESVRPPPVEPDVLMYKAMFAFEGQTGEMTLVKDETYELIEKSDNGWWFVKHGVEESWAPNDYLELVPPKHKPAAAHSVASTSEGVQTWRESVASSSRLSPDDTLSDTESSFQYTTSDTDASFEQRGLPWLGEPRYRKHVCLLTPCL
jgi:hypothetical protein